MRAQLVASALVAGAVAVAVSGPVRADDDQAKKEAQGLVTEGVGLLKAKNYDDALAKFEAAYARFPSPKILLNIGTTQKEMGRIADAANTYQQYMADPATPPERVAEVKKILNQLDAQVVLLTVEVTPAGAEVSIDGRPWQPVAGALLTRVAPGTRLVRARGTGLEPAETSVSGSPGDKRKVALALVAAKVSTPAPAPTTAPAPATASRGLPLRYEDEGAADEDGASVAATAERDNLPGAFVQARIDGKLRGSAVAVGVTYAPIPVLEAELAMLRSEVFGVYAGARWIILPSTLRPHVAAGLPIFFSNGTRYGTRLAAGGEVDVTSHVSVVAELGFEHFFNPEIRYETNVFVPVVGLHGRL